MRTKKTLHFIRNLFKAFLHRLYPYEYYKMQSLSVSKCLYLRIP